MAQNTTLEASIRSKKASTSRHSGALPAVVYGRGIEARSIELNPQAFLKVLKAAGQTSLVSLELEGETVPVLIREIQHHTLRDQIIHADLYQVRMDEEIEADVPLRFVGEASAIKDMAGVLVRNLDELTIKALPQNLPHDIDVDISSLVDFEAVIRVVDIKLPEGVVALQDAEDVIALVQAPRTEAELEALSEEVTEDVTSVEGVEKPEADAESDGGSAESTKPEEAPAE